ncbi:hypothetical protein pb186bvf_007386 [Paramecium bursaria]
MYSYLVQPTLRVPEQQQQKEKKSDEKPQSTPKYLLKVPIPQLQGFQVISHQNIPSFSAQKQDRGSGSKENQFSQVTFENKRWNPDSQDSGQKILSHSGKKQNTEQDDGILQHNLLLGSNVEKSYSEAAQKILKIKTLELENKVSLLVIENERLTSFLNDQFQETEKLTNDNEQLQSQLESIQKSYEDKINIVLLENDKLQSINKSLEQKVDQMMLQRKQLMIQKEEEVNSLKEELNKILRKEVVTIDIKRKQDINYYDQTVQQLQFEKVELEKLIQDQQLKIQQIEQQFRDKDIQLYDKAQLSSDFENALLTIENQIKTIQQQEARIDNLEQRLDIMVGDNKQLTEIIENQQTKEKVLQKALEDRQYDNDKEISRLKEMHEKEIKQIQHKQKKQIEEIQFTYQDQLRNGKLQIESQMIQDVENTRIQLNNKENELKNQVLIFKEREKSQQLEYQREIEIKNQFIQNIQQSHDMMKHQMDQLERLTERMQADNEQLIGQKDSEIAKLTKQLHLKEQSQKQLSHKLDELIKKVKKLEEQRDELSEEITFKNDKNKELEMRLDIMSKENDNLENQLQIVNQQLQIQNQRYESLEQQAQKELEDMKIQTSIDAQSSIEQCIIQYQQQIKYEQERSEKLEKDLLKMKDKAKHFEMLSAQINKDLLRAHSKIQEITDVLEQNALQARKQEDLVKENNYELNQQQERYMKLQSNYEIEIDTLKRQMQDMAFQNEEILQNFEKSKEQLRTLSHKNQKVMEDLTTLTKLKMDQETQNKKLQQQLSQLSEENHRNHQEANKYKSQIHQHQQEIEEITRSFQQNYQDKEVDLQNKYDNTIYDLRQQLNSVTNKYNDLARKERDNRFRLKLLKSSGTKLPSEMEDDNCYQVMKQKLDDQSEYIQRLLIENEKSKGELQQFQMASKKSSFQKTKSDFLTEDTERTLKAPQYASQKKQPIKVMNYAQSQKVLDRDVYLGGRGIVRQQSLQRF